MGLSYLYKLIISIIIVINLIRIRNCISLQEQNDTTLDRTSKNLFDILVLKDQSNDYNDYDTAMNSSDYNDNNNETVNYDGDDDDAGFYVDLEFNITKEFDNLSVNNFTKIIIDKSKQLILNNDTMSNDEFLTNCSYSEFKKPSNTTGIIDAIFKVGKDFGVYMLLLVLVILILNLSVMILILVNYVIYRRNLRKSKNDNVAGFNFRKKNMSFDFIDNGYRQSKLFGQSKLCNDSSFLKTNDILADNDYQFENFSSNFSRTYERLNILAENDMNNDNKNDDANKENDFYDTAIEMFDEDSSSQDNNAQIYGIAKQTDYRFKFKTFTARKGGASNKNDESKMKSINSRHDFLNIIKLNSSISKDKSKQNPIVDI